MTSPLDFAIQEELRLVEAIKQNSRRLTAPLLVVLVKTFVPPALVFVAFAVFGPVVVPVIERLSGGVLFPSTLYIAGFLLTILLVWRVWRWSETRFGGVVLLRRLGQVTMAVLNVEKAIDAARANPSQASVQQVRALTRRAWDLYAEAMRAYGLEVE
ncbi:MAG: hypothetical protein HZC41_03100 [Chloroflexi bacterium]|nr:hypothetical protein [Chloroflexota bacterium]